MTKRLYILRHSKAEDGNHDHDRDLDARGVTLCEHVGAYLASCDSKPQICISSSSARTMQTAEHSLRNAGIDIPIVSDERVYLAAPETILSVVQQADDEAHSLLIVGHNPGMHLSALQFYATGDASAFDTMAHSFTPPAIAVYDFDVESWGLVGWKEGTLVDFRDKHALQLVS